MNGVLGMDATGKLGATERGESIFQGVVRNEGSFTRLLFNFMSRDEKFCKNALSLFAGQSITDATLHIEKHLPNGGIADLLIQNAALSVIVEVKSENFRGRTAKQMLSNADNNPESYLAYLESCSVPTRLLVFLVPPDWKHRADVDAEIAGYTREGRHKRVGVRLVTWEELLSCHTPDGTFTGLLYREFRHLLEQRFGSIRLQESEVNSMTDGTMSLVSLVKLNALVEEVRKKAKRAGLDVSRLEAQETEFGFYLIDRLADKKEEWSLFFGCSPEDWEEKDRPVLGFGVDKSLIEENAFKRAVKKNMTNPRFNQQIADSGAWLYVAIPNEDLKAGSDVIWSRLRNVWTMVRKKGKNASQRRTLGVK